MNDAEKVKAIRTELGLTQAKLGEALKVTKSHISEVEAGKKNLSMGIIQLMKIRYAISDEWWETGTGEMFLDNMQRLTIGVKAAEAWLARGKKESPDILGLSWDEKLILEHYRKLSDQEKAKRLSELIQLSGGTEDKA